MSELSELTQSVLRHELGGYSINLLMNRHCPNCGHQKTDFGEETICEKCDENLGERHAMIERVEDAKEVVLAESIESELVKHISETSKLDYMLKLEKFFDDRDLYLYDGWEDAQILAPPDVGKFWVTLDLRVPAECQLKGALRCTTGKEGQNTAKYKQMEDGTYFVRFKILRRILDKIEMTEKDRAEEIADAESEV